MKSSELSEKQKKMLKEYCKHHTECGKCGYDKQCINYSEFVSDMIRNDDNFEIDLLPEHREEKMNPNTKCKNCGKEKKIHNWSDANKRRCPLVDYQGCVVMSYWDKTFFEPEESEVDRLIECLESGDICMYHVAGYHINFTELLKELKNGKNNTNR